MSGKADHIRNELQLPKRQREVLGLLAGGATTKAIAEVLALNAKTVEYHRAKLMQRTHLCSCQELTRLAVRLKMVDTNP